MTDWGNLRGDRVLRLDQPHRDGLLHRQLLVREDRNVALDTRLRLVRHRVLARPLALALMTLELSVALLPSLVRRQLIVGSVEAHRTVGDIVPSSITDVALVLRWWRLLR